MKIQKSCQAVDDRHLLPMKGDVIAEFDDDRHCRTALPRKGVRQGHEWRKSTAVRGQARSYIDMCSVMAPA